MTERHVSEASLLEISVVARGANPNTEASMREAELLAEIRELRAMMITAPAANVEVTTATDLDGLRKVLAEREYRIPISKELTALLERRK